MTTSYFDYLDVRHFVDQHLEKHRVGLRGRWKLRRAVRHIRRRIPNIQMSMSTVMRYRHIERTR